MQITIHRGCREIGGSCIELQSGTSRVILDLGMPLVEADGTQFNMDHRSDLKEPELVESGVLPDIPGLYYWDRTSPAVDGLLLSHAHMDHYGFCNFIHPQLPVYTGEATSRLLKINALFTPFNGIAGRNIIFRNKTSFYCGGFRITPFLVDHSAFDAYAFLLEAGGKRLFYSGDFREHGRKPWALPALLQALSGTPIDALLLEGTMLGRPGEKTLSEKEIEEELVRLLHAQQAPALICVSAQNIDRLVSLYRAAIRCRRLLVVDVYTASVLEELKEFARIPHPSAKYELLRVFFPVFLCRRLEKEGHYDRVRRFEDFQITGAQINETFKEIMMMVRPSMLKDLQKLNLPHGSAFIYSMWKGYQDEAGMERLMNFARSKKMDIQYIHSSGHATPGTLKKLVDALKPAEVIPIHTYFPEKYHDLGASVRILKDGERFNL